MPATVLFLATVLSFGATAIVAEPAEPPATEYGAAHLDSTWRHWAYSRPITIDPTAIEQRLVRVPISEVYTHAKEDLADLRVIDDSGNETGYVLFDGIPATGGGERWYPTKMIDSGHVDGQYTHAIADTANSGRVHSLVKIELLDRQNEFFAWAEISSSPDYETWRTLRTRAPVYHFKETGESQAMRVTYPPTRDRWLRLRLQRADQAVPIASLRVAAQTPADFEVALEDAGLELTARHDAPADESSWESRSDSETGWIDGVRIETLREEFYRPVRVSASADGDSWREVGRGLVYRLLSESGESDGSGARESLQVAFRTGDSDRFWRVVVLDGDDAPIDDLRVTLLRKLRSVIFRPQADNTYQLLYGHRRAERTQYELTQLVDHAQMAAAPLAALGAEAENPGFVSSEPFSERYPVLMWTALGLAVLVLANLAIRSLRSGPSSSD